MNSNESSTVVSAGVDKAALYGRFQDVEEWNKKRLAWQDDLQRRAAHKALDMGDPDDVGDVNVTGIDAKGVAAIIAEMQPKKSGSILGKLALAAAIATPFTIIEAFKTEPAPVVIDQEPLSDTNTQYELQFFED